MLGCCIKIWAAESNDTQEAEHAWSIDHQLVRLYGKVMGGTVGEGCGQTGQFGLWIWSAGLSAASLHLGSRLSPNSKGVGVLVLN
jgi:hypothetical protein